MPPVARAVLSRAKLRFPAQPSPRWVVESLGQPHSNASSFPVGTWLSLVEHSLGVRGVGSSNLPVPTIPSPTLTLAEGSLSPFGISPAGSLGPPPRSRSHIRFKFKSARPDHFLFPKVSVSTTTVYCRRLD